MNVKALLIAVLLTSSHHLQGEPLVPAMLAGDRNLGTVCVFPEDAFLHAGKGGRIVNVKMPPFSAVGDGKADDTKALIRAYDFVAEKIRQYGIHDANASYIIYLPGGTYLVSDTILYSGPVVDYTASHPGFEGLASVRFIGESRESTVIRLQDHCPGFESGAAKPVLRYAKTDFNNAETKSTFRNICINTGRGNPGAIGLDFNGANGNSISNVFVVSEDGAGFIGIHFRVPPTQGYHHDLTVIGFDYGISSDPYHAQQNSFEFITLCQQRQAAIRVLQSGLSIRKLKSENVVPVLRQERAGSHVVLIDSELTGGREEGVALVSPHGQLFVRNVAISGYGKALEKEGHLITRGKIDEFVSGLVLCHPSQTVKRSMNLPVKDVPLIPLPSNASDWANVNDYGAQGDGKTDDSAAIQRALNAGKPVVYFPSKAYHVASAVSVAAEVRRIMGLYTHISGGDVVFRIAENADAPLMIEDFDAGVGLLCDHEAPRTLVLQNIASASPYRNRNKHWSTVFANCVNGLGKENPFINQEVYCRFINTERKTGPNFYCDNAVMWVLGYKVESSFENFLVRNGGQLEVLGGVANQTPFTTKRPANSTDVIVRNVGSSVSLVLHSNGRVDQPDDKHFRFAVVDEGDGDVEEIAFDDLPPRPGEPVGSRSGSYKNQRFLPLYVHYRE